jgi:predicted Na+-dependent transporter
MSLSPGERAYCAALVNQFSGLFFIVWVILPTLAGFLARIALTPERVAAAQAWLNLASASSLLLLNYINSALALPEIRQSPAPLLAATALFAALLSVVGLVAGWLIAWLMRMKPETRIALMFGLSMKHTGLALILAGAVLANAPIATLMIVLATLMQHLLAGVVQRWCRSNAAVLP